MLSVHLAALHCFALPVGLPQSRSPPQRVMADYDASIEPQKHERSLVILGELGVGCIQHGSVCYLIAIAIDARSGNPMEAIRWKAVVAQHGSWDAMPDASSFGSEDPQLAVTCSDPARAFAVDSKAHVSLPCVLARRLTSAIPVINIYNTNTIHVLMKLIH